MNNIKSLIKKLPLGSGVKVLNYDPDTTLFALDKTEGLRSHPNKPGIDKNSLLLAPYDGVQECYFCDVYGVGQIPVFLLNRLDAPTSGVILLCLNAELVPEIHKLFKQHKVQKTYTAIVKGIAKIKQGTWRDKLSSQKLGEKVRTQKGGERLAETDYQQIGRNNYLGISLCELMPVTGLTHQLRVQGALHNHPILGDKTYGDFSFNKEIQRKTSCKRLFLHSSKIHLSYSFKQKGYTFTAESRLPEEFDAFMEFNPKSDGNVLRQ